jgi:hypothetical protein
MSVLDTFYILFKSNSEEAIKGNQRYEKSNKDLTKSLKDTSEESEKVGYNFVRMAESAAGAIGAIGGFEILKSGVQDAINLNTNLKVLADNYQTTADKLRAAGLATQLAGGDFGTGVSNAIKLSRANRAVGLAGGDPEQNIRQLRTALGGRSILQQQALLDKFGITDEFTRRELTSMSQKEFEDNFKKANYLSKDTNKASLDAYEANKSEVNLSGSTQGFFNRLLTAIANPLNSILGILSSLVAGTGPVVGTAAVVGATTLSTLGVAGVIKRVLKSGSKAIPAAEGAAVTGAEVAGGVVALGAADALATGVAIGAGVAAVGYGGYKLFGLYQNSVNNFAAKFHKKPMAKSFLNHST